MSSTGKVDLGYTTFGSTAFAVTSVGGKTRKELRSGPLKVRRDMFIGNISFLFCSASVAMTSTIKSYLIYERELDDPNFDVGGRDPGNKWENGYAWLPGTNLKRDVKTSQRANSSVLWVQSTQFAIVEEFGITKGFVYLMLCFSVSVTRSNSISFVVISLNKPDIIEPVDSEGLPYNIIGGDSSAIDKVYAGVEFDRVCNFVERLAFALVEVVEDDDDAVEFIGDNADEDLREDVGVNYRECELDSGSGSSCSRWRSDPLLNTFANKVIVGVLLVIWEG